MASYALIPQTTGETVKKLDNTLTNYRSDMQMAIAEGDEMARGFIAAAAIQQLRQLMTPEAMKDVMALMNTPIGFMTDRDDSKPRFNKKTKSYDTPTPYKAEVVRDCVIEGLLKGARPVNNEINIISGRCYLAKSFYERMVKSVEGVTNFSYQIGVPSRAQGGALVVAKASWKLDGQQQTLQCLQTADGDFRIPVKTYETDSADMIRGKATRKFLCAVYEQMTGQRLEEFDEPVADDPTTIDGEATVVTEEPDQEKSPEAEEQVPEPTAPRPLSIMDIEARLQEMTEDDATNIIDVNLYVSDCVSTTTWDENEAKDIAALQDWAVNKIRSRRGK